MRMTGMKKANHVPVVALVAMGFVLGGGFSAARAQEKTNYRDVYGNVLSAVGLGQDRDPIDYTARAPIAVPPSNDLPPPAEGGKRRAAGFPNDPDVFARRKAAADPRQPVPPGEGGAARSYLIEPPANYFDAAAVTATGTNADHGDDPAPKHARKRKAKAVAAQ